MRWGPVHLNRCPDEGKIALELDRKHFPRPIIMEGGRVGNGQAL